MALTAARQQGLSRVQEGKYRPCWRGGSINMRRTISRMPEAEPMRPLHRRMSLAAFEGTPRRPGWKHEYYGGQAHITPSHTTVSFLLDLAPAPSPHPLPPG